MQLVITLDILIKGPVQKVRNSSALAMELHLSGSNLWIYQKVMHNLDELDLFVVSDS